MPDKNAKKPANNGKGKPKKKNAESEESDRIDSLLDAGSGFTDN
jgi:hypothetical protein